MRRLVEPPAGAAFRFRRMRAEDLERVMQIERDGFSHPWSRELLERELSHVWSTILVAEDPHERSAVGILGFVIFWIVHDEVHILNIATAVESRRRGVGRALMNEAADLGRRRGATLSTLEVRRTNTPAVDLYRSLGYRQVGIRPNYYADEGEDAIVMVLAL